MNKTDIILKHCIIQYYIHCALLHRVTPVLLAQSVRMALLDSEVSPEREVCPALW